MTSDRDFTVGLAAAAAAAVVEADVVVDRASVELLLLLLLLLLMLLTASSVLRPWKGAGPTEIPSKSRNRNAEQSNSIQQHVSNISRHSYIKRVTIPSHFGMSCQKSHLSSRIRFRTNCHLLNGCPRHYFSLDIFAKPGIWWRLNGR